MFWTAGSKKDKVCPAENVPKTTYKAFPAVVSTYFLTKLEATGQYSHLFPGTFYHLHFHVKFAAFNHRVYVFTLLIHFHLVTSTAFFIHLHTIIGLITEKFLLQFVKKETPAQ